MGGADAEGADREGRSAREEEEEEGMDRYFHITVMLSKIRQAIRWATNMEGGGVTPLGWFFSPILVDQSWMSSGRINPECV